MKSANDDWRNNKLHPQKLWDIFLIYKLFLLIYGALFSKNYLLRMQIIQIILKSFSKKYAIFQKLVYFHQSVIFTLWITL